MALTRKREARKMFGQPAWITLDGGFAARQCVVQDISSTGAKICVDEAAGLPARLWLAFSRDARTGRECHVVWRRSKTAGVRFMRYGNHQRHSKFVEWPTAYGQLKNSPAPIAG